MKTFNDAGRFSYAEFRLAKPNSSRSFMTLLAAVCSGICLSPSVLWAQTCNYPTKPPAPSSYNTFTDVTYEQVGDQTETLNIFVPKNVSNPPLIMLVHGGGYSAGTANAENKNAQAFTALGFAVASINYRLDTDARNIFPAPIQDARCAIRWLRAHAKQYGFAAEKMGVLGGSSGGTMVGLLGTTGTWSADQLPNLDSPSCPVGTDVSAAVQAVGMYFGNSDLANTQFIPAKHVTILTKYLGLPDSAAALAASPLAKQASPVTYITAQSPPFVLVHGSKDIAVLTGQIDEMDEELTRAGVPHSHFEIPDLGHGISPFYSQSTSDLLAQSTCAMIEMMRTQLAP